MAREDTPAWQRSFEALQAEVGGCAEWRVEWCYADESVADELSGFHAVHTRSGFVADVLWASVVPQALMWVNTPLDSDRGDAHTGEHLLLGKGNRGRAVAQIEEMALAHSTAWTGRLRTCYTFQCAAGADTFCALLGAKLQALLAPDATDEEIAREVCHVALCDGDALLEKGTVLNEMVGSFLQPDFCSYHALNRMLYEWAPPAEGGARSHPLAFEAGGTPQAIRTARPALMRAFHNERYALRAMGAVLAVSPLLASPCDLLRRVHECLLLAHDTPRPWRDEGRAANEAVRYPAVDLEEAWLPPPAPAPPGTVHIVRVPIATATAPGQLVAAWPDVMPPHLVAGPEASIKLSLLQMLVELVAGGATSELHPVLVSMDSRTCDVGATSISGYVSSEPGRAVCIGLGGVPPAALTEEALQRVGEAMRGAFAKVAALPDDSPSLLAFNRRALSQLRTMQRGSRQFLSSPPRFGVRGVHDEWLTHLHDARRCARAGATTVFLSFVAEAAQLEALLSGTRNVWAEHIAAWGLAARLPVLVATRADPEFAAALEREREARMAALVDDMLDAERALCGDAAAEADAAADADALRAAALSRFRAAYDAATAVIDAAVASAPSPGPPPDPPMTEDDLDAVSLTLPGGGSLFAARFVGMTGGHAGIAFSLAGVPVRLLGALCALPACLRNVGVTTRRGEAVDYRALCARLQDEVLYVDPSFTLSRASGRVELQLRAAGLTRGEALAAFDWMEALITAPDLSPACLPRVRDGVDAALSGARATVERRGEFYVDGFATSLLENVSPALLLADNAIARAHALHRLRWRLRDVPASADADALAALLSLLAAAPTGLATRAQLEAALAACAADGGAWPSGVPGCDALCARFTGAPPGVQVTFRAAAADLRCVLPCVPDASLAADWRTLCDDLAEDMRDSPTTVLTEWRDLLAFLRCRTRARAFLAAGPANLTPLAAALRALVARMPAGFGAASGDDVVAPATASTRFGTALTRAAARGALRCSPSSLSPPPYLALVIPRLPVGGVVSMAACAAYDGGTCDEGALLDMLAAQTLAGGGSHSLFLRGWGAGLAYSCGVSVGLAEGRVRYYADTCPDVGKCVAAAAAEVVSDAAGEPVAWRVDYALAQCFTCRAGTSMPESRVEAAATDEADGRGAHAVRSLRAALLRLRGRASLAAELHERVPRVLGALLPGVLPASPFATQPWSGAARSPGATLVVIGAEAQAAALDAHLAGVAAKVGVPSPACVRLYERDLWVVAGARPQPRQATASGADNTRAFVYGCTLVCGAAALAAVAYARVRSGAR
jgi:hypothetical protein